MLLHSGTVSTAQPLKLGCVWRPGSNWVWIDQRPMADVVKRTGRTGKASASHAVGQTVRVETELTVSV
jgi:hypothetical protein